MTIIRKIIIVIVVIIILLNVKRRMINMCLIIFIYCYFALSEVVGDIYVSDDIFMALLNDNYQLINIYVHVSIYAVLFNIN